ncbi:DMT family transporter [Aliiroseovarius sp. KMU-50]|uniref:DMT family transporter n=1 Tax=Aliiroseovarius salicola TaxID=3009082 RepID=A0ABT4W543_9RHOB|nr:DMT family transporter [Aliiroseovarius sp. KMU-50]MDA5095640.1 DMT family transporter [Aliiroseovarius sp. KMU-50]
MRLFALTSLTMIAFAANSLLNRAALAGDASDPLSFALIRVASGAVMLVGLVSMHQGFSIRRPDLWGVIALTVYLLGFSYAYLEMDAGLGALILFGGVQVTMFAGAVYGGETLPAMRWIGAVLALSGLALLLWPSEGISLSLVSFFLMSVAAVGWGVYSLIGRGATDPLGATAWNFIYSLPLVAMVWVSSSSEVVLSLEGVALAIFSGAITSGLGYALWYSILPRLGATIGALAQLSVPVIAIAMGVVLLGETLTMHMVVSALLVLGGIAVGMVKIEINLNS